MSADDEQEISIHAAHGTCRPDMRIRNGECKGCGRVVLPSCMRRNDRACSSDEGPGCYERLDCKGFVQEWRRGREDSSQANA